MVIAESNLRQKVRESKLDVLLHRVILPVNKILMSKFVDGLHSWVVTRVAGEQESVEWLQEHMVPCCLIACPEVSMSASRI